MWSSFNIVCLILAIFYGLVGLLSVIQTVILCRREDNDSIRICSLRTVQQKAHFIVTVLCGIRAAFFFVAVVSWDSEDGVIKANNDAFYILDQFSTVMFFSLTTILALFWAELYYIAVDKVGNYEKVVRPATYLLNVVAYIAICVTSYLDIRRGDTDHIKTTTAIVMAVTYFVAALLFGVYAYRASKELSLVPIQLSARKSRLQTLKMLAVICVSVLVIRPAVVIALTGKTLQIVTPLSIALFVLYFLVLELLPILATVTFYRVEVVDNSYGAYSEEEEAEIWETSPLNPDSSHSRSFDGTKYSSGSPRNNDNNDEIVESIISRLSVSNANRNKVYDDDLI